MQGVSLNSSFYMGQAGRMSALVTALRFPLHSKRDRKHPLPYARSMCSHKPRKEATMRKGPAGAWRVQPCGLRSSRRARILSGAPPRTSFRPPAALIIFRNAELRSLCARRRDIEPKGFRVSTRRQESKGHRCGPGECRQGVSGIAAGPELRQNAGARRTTRLRAPDSDDAAQRTKGF
jgi:hypothetical protein